jgi:hypothetical protein
MGAETGRTHRSRARAAGSALITLAVLRAACAAPRSPGSDTALAPSTSEPAALPTGPVTDPPEAGASAGSATGEPTDDVVFSPGYPPYHRVLDSVRAASERQRTD